MNYYLAVITSPNADFDTATVLIAADCAEDAREKAYMYYHPEWDVYVQIQPTIGLAET